jgi:Lipocalin-like domain
MGLGGSVPEGHDMLKMRERLIGAWTLVSYVLEPSDGSEPIHPMGTEPLGFIMYTPDGYMSAQIMRTGRPAFASGNPAHGTPEEFTAAARGYLAYSGPFRTDDATATVTHAADVSLFPNWAGVAQVRRVAFEGDVLRLSTVRPTVFGGRQFNAQITWRRAIPN